MELLAALQRGEGLRPRLEPALQKPPELVTGLFFFPPLTRFQLFFKSSVKHGRIALKPFITNHPDQIISAAGREVLNFQPGLMSTAEK